jgi:phosphoribosylaminoimidazole-succinocarboxamide synthase
MIGADLARELEERSLALYELVSEHARERGIILADTKLEFGIDETGALVLGDEAFTPDSSRFWPAEEYRAGSTPPSFDKQYVRDYCESLGWDKSYPGPELPDDVVDGTRARYIEAFEQLTGLSFDAYLADPNVVLG